MIDQYLERERLMVLPARLETITIAAGPVDQVSKISSGNQSGGGSGQFIDGELDGRFDGLFGFPSALTF